MQKKIANILFSTRLMGFLFIAYFMAMIVGTFLDYGQETSPTPYSRYWVYNSWWFTGIHIFLAINFIGNIFRYRLLRKEKITTLTFHLSFILILIGAGITRYISYEGVMPIEEGTAESTFLSEKTYLDVLIDKEHEGTFLRRTRDKELSLSPRLNNKFNWKTDFKEDPINIRFNKFIHGAEEGFIDDPNGDNHIKLVEAGEGTRHDHYIKEGELVSIHNVLYAFNKPTDGAINIGYDGEAYSLQTPFEGQVRVMATQQDSQVLKDSVQPLKLRALYQLQGIQFVIPETVVRGRPGIVESLVKEKNQQDALFVDVIASGETKTVGLMGGRGYANDKKRIDIGDYSFYLSYGSKELELPFAIRLNDFQATKYPGTEQSYQSFESKITVEPKAGDTFDYDIYMNHVLDHKGYRFFQASFFPDESGTILSVSHDFWGTWITYIGYFLLYLGLMLILFDKGSRFGELKNMLDKVKKRKAKLLTVLMIFAFAKAYTTQAQQVNTSAVVIEDTIASTEALQDDLLNILPDTTTQPDLPTAAEIDSIIVANAIPVEQAAKFGRVVIQDNGRFMPINTFSSLLLRKLTRKETYAGLTADQVMLSMIENPYIWYSAEILYLKKGNDSIRNIIGVPSDVKRFKLVDFFTEKGNYKLGPYLQDAYSAAVPTVFDKEFRDIDQRLGLFNNTLNGEILKIFPKPNDPDNKWLSYPELKEAAYTGMDSVYSKQVIPIYLQLLREGRKTGNYEEANKILESISDFQKRFNPDVILSKEKIDAEIYYNKHDVFKKLYWLYMLAALFMFVFVISGILKQSKLITIATKIGAVAVIILFLVHTGGLIWRWYVSGHAPWSDAYESILFVGWATVLFGLILGRKSMMTIAATTFVASFILWAASMNWLNPEITTLQPVLNSYWLMIHTAVIVASYGPFALSFILGAIALLLMVFTTEKNKTKMELSIKEITIVNEMALTVGMILLAIGTFLGGQWANESWGRYWGWDPKETWALISLIVYAFVIHMRLIPGLRGRWLFNVCSVYALGSILFTYFGVNYYLSGLHAYQSGGDIAGTTIIIVCSVIGIICAWAYYKYKKYYKVG